MKNSGFKIRIPDLTELDKLKLAKELGSETVTFETQSLPAGTLGELTTLAAVVIVSLSALRVLAIHLARKHQGRDASITTEVTSPDGTVSKTTVRISSKSSDAPDAQVLKQLGAACNVDISSLIKK